MSIFDIWRCCLNTYLEPRSRTYRDWCPVCTIPIKVVLWDIFRANFSKKSGVFVMVSKRNSGLHPIRFRFCRKNWSCEKFSRQITSDRQVDRHSVYENKNCIVIFTWFTVIFTCIVLKHARVLCILQSDYGDARLTHAPVRPPDEIAVGSPHRI